MLQAENSAIIIGSGLTGLSLALRLASAGTTVSVFEKNPQHGGFLSLDNHRGYADPRINEEELSELRKLFTEAGDSLEKRFEFEELEVYQKYILANGRTINAFTDRQKFFSEVTSNFEEDEKGFEDYMEDKKWVAKNLASALVDQPRRKWYSATYLKLLRFMKPAYLKSIHQFNNARFRQQDTIELFNYRATAYGMFARRTPALFALLMQGTFVENAYLLKSKNSDDDVINAIYQLAVDCGVSFHFGAEVERIIYREGKAEGVVANHRNFMSSVVISTADISNTYTRLLKDRYVGERFLKKGLSSSAVIFYWEINKVFPGLHYCNTFLAEQPKKKGSGKKNVTTPLGPFTIYATEASSGDNNTKAYWKIIFMVPAVSRSEYGDIIDNAKAAVLSRMSEYLETEIESFIVSERVDHPGNISDKLMVAHGSLYGPVVEKKWPGFNRHPNHHRQISKLYFAGNTVHPGPGMALCLKSSAIVAQLIKKARGKSQQ